MKLKVKVNGVDTDITLTPENIREVNTRSRSITDRIQTWEDVCSINGEDSILILPYTTPKNDFEEWMNAVCIVAKTIDAYAEGWVPDYSNSNEEKWFLRHYWDDSKSGFGFSLSGTRYDYSASNVGARLSFQTEAKALDFQKKFGKVYITMLTKHKAIS